MRKTAEQRPRLPLGALRSFESFARLGDVAAAAAELGITASAVSHQLAALEALLEQALTQRQGRRLVLTADGRRYFEAIGPAFLLLHSATAQLRDRTHRRRILVSALPLLATGWLMPRLMQFQAVHPEVELQVQYARYRNYSSDAADVSLRFGDGNWAGYSSRLLLSGTAVPIGVPGLRERFGPLARPSDFLGVPLVHDGSTDQWNGWFRQARVAPGGPLRGMVCEDGMLTRAAMVAGAGVALSRPVLLEREIAAGQLAVLSRRSVSDGQDYYLCVRSDVEAPPAARQLVEWLRRQAMRKPAAAAHR